MTKNLPPKPPVPAAPGLSPKDVLEQSHAVLSSIPSILITINAKGNITSWNQVTEHKFGITAAEVLNRPWEKCGIQWDHGKLYAGMEESRSLGKPVRVDDVVFKRTNGEKGILGFTVIPILGEAGNALEWILFGADVTERKNLEMLKDEFIGTVSHELRTPLTVMREATSQVHDGMFGPLNEEQKRILTMSMSAMDRLERIISDLLDISKIEAGKFTLKIQPVDMVEVVKEVLTAFRIRLRNKGLTVKENYPAEEIEIHADRDKIIQVLTNLIGNAIKFTDKGGLEISVELRGDEMECSIRDTGKGIGQEDLPKVFSKFEQFDRVPGPGDMGTGLGLAISKGIVERHGGKIWVESKLGQGSRFAFILPRKPLQ